MNPSSPTPIHLDTLAVIEAARAAHAYGLLTAQAPDEDDRECWYEHQGRVCAIGAALPDDLLDEALTGPVPDLFYEEVITGDCRALTLIQNAHDLWAQCRDETAINDHERAFLRTLSEVGGRHG